MQRDLFTEVALDYDARSLIEALIAGDPDVFSRIDANLLWEVDNDSGVTVTILSRVPGAEEIRVDLQPGSHYTVATNSDPYSFTRLSGDFDVINPAGESPAKRGGAVFAAGCGDLVLSCVGDRIARVIVTRLTA